MKKRISCLFLILIITCKISIKAQCGITQLSIQDSLVIKSIRGYINHISQLNPDTFENLTKKKTNIVLINETKEEHNDCIAKRVIKVGVCDNNYFKFHKMIINGYFYLDNVLFLVTSPFMGMFQTDSYDYENPCLKKILLGYSLKEYEQPKRTKVMRNNAEAEILEMGGKLHSYGCSIVLGVDKKAGYKLLYEL